MDVVVPIGIRFMEPLPDCRIPGRYDENRHIWVGDDGQPALLEDATATGSNASTGASQETDWNEDYD
jgi:hypothetical protein